MVRELLLCCFLASVHSNDVTRYASDTTYNNSFSTDAFDALNRGKSGTVFSKNSFQVPPFCTPLQFNAVIRHGIRSPDHTDLDGIHELYQKFLDSTNKKKLHNPEAKRLYGNWIPTFTHEFELQLVPAGIVEVKSIASRFQQMFPSLLHSETSKLLFISGHKDRTRETCEAFHEVLRGPTDDFQQKLDIRDDIIRFFDMCPKYAHDVMKSKRATKELAKFENSVHFNDMAKRMSAKLNVSHIKQNIRAMYDISALEEAVNGWSLWSGLLDEQDLQVMEYAMDLQDYWTLGYGHAINYEQSCPLLADLMQHMEEAVRGDSYNDSIVRCSHAETLEPLVALMGLFKDKEPLRADNFHQQHHRAYATSKICPFSANLALVLYQCDQNSEDWWDPEQDTGEREGVRYPQWPPKLERHMVQLLYNELPVQLPFCDYDLCPYSLVEQHYGRIAQNCDFNKICELTTSREEAVNADTLSVREFWATLLHALKKSTS